MKESAVDCVLFRNSNIIETNKKVKQITSSGVVLNLSLSDRPYSSICDYKKDCNYSCNWMPNPREKYPINTDTYNIRFASNNIEKIKKEIKNMFREDIIYYLGLIESNILKKFPDTDKLFIYVALEELVNNRDEIIYDKFSRKGYIIYRGDYYIFQPFDLEREEIPLIYRINPSDIKTDSVDLENIILDYKEIKENIIKTNKPINTKFIDNMFKNIDDIYKIHLGIIDFNKNSLQKNEYLYAIIETLYDRLNLNKLLEWIENILKDYLKKVNIQYMSEIISFLKNKKY